MKNYPYGRSKEYQVGEFLERRRFIWSISLGSRGVIDILAERELLKWAIQVKATRSLAINSKRLNLIDSQKLIEAAKKKKATPVLALVTRNFVALVRLPDLTVIIEGELKPLKYDYLI